MSKIVFTPAERYPNIAYKLEGITYVPHYKLDGYAYPGITKTDEPISKQRLLDAGAKPIEVMLYGTGQRGK